MLPDIYHSFFSELYNLAFGLCRTTTWGFLWLVSSEKLTLYKLYLPFYGFILWVWHSVPPPLTTKINSLKT